MPYYIFNTDTRMVIGKQRGDPLSRTLSGPVRPGVARVHSETDVSSDDLYKYRMNKNNNIERIKDRDIKEIEDAQDWRTFRNTREGYWSLFDKAFMIATRDNDTGRLDKLSADRVLAKDLPSLFPEDPKAAISKIQERRKNV